MNYWLKMARIKELFEEKHPLNYWVMESPAGNEFVRIHSYDCCGMGWSDDDYYLDELLDLVERCKSDDAVNDVLLSLDRMRRCIHVQHNTEIGQDWDEAVAATLPQVPGDYTNWRWLDLSGEMNRRQQYQYPKDDEYSIHLVD